MVGRGWSILASFFSTYSSCPTSIFSPSRVEAGGVEERLENEVQMVCTSLVLSVVFYWLTFSVFNHHDYDRYLTTGVSVQDLRGLPLRSSCTPCDVLPCSLPLTELSLWQRLLKWSMSAIFCKCANTYKICWKLCLTNLCKTVCLTSDSFFLILPSTGSPSQLSAFRFFSMNSRHPSLCCCLLLKWGFLLGSVTLSHLNDKSTVGSNMLLAGEWGIFPFLQVLLVSSSLEAAITWL